MLPTCCELIRIKHLYMDNNIIAKNHKNNNVRVSPKFPKIFQIRCKGGFCNPGEWILHHGVSGVSRGIETLSLSG